MSSQEGVLVKVEEGGIGTLYSTSTRQALFVDISHSNGFTAHVGDWVTVSAEGILTAKMLPRIKTTIDNKGRVQIATHVIFAMRNSKWTVGESVVALCAHMYNVCLSAALLTRLRRLAPNRRTITLLNVTWCDEQGDGAGGWRLLDQPLPTGELLTKLEYTQMMAKWKSDSQVIQFMPKLTPSKAHLPSSYARVPSARLAVPVPVSKPLPPPPTSPSPPPPPDIANKYAECWSQGQRVDISEWHEGILVATCGSDKAQFWFCAGQQVVSWPHGAMSNIPLGACGLLRLVERNTHAIYENTVYEAVEWKEVKQTVIRIVPHSMGVQKGEVKMECHCTVLHIRASVYTTGDTRALTHPFLGIVIDIENLMPAFLHKPGTKVLVRVCRARHPHDRSMSVWLVRGVRDEVEKDWIYSSFHPNSNLPRPVSVFSAAPVTPAPLPLPPAAVQQPQPDPTWATPKPSKSSLRSVMRRNRNNYPVGVEHGMDMPAETERKPRRVTWSPNLMSSWDAPSAESSSTSPHTPSHTQDTEVRGVLLAVGPSGAARGRSAWVDRARAFLVHLFEGEEDDPLAASEHSDSLRGDENEQDDTHADSYSLNATLSVDEEEEEAGRKQDGNEGMIGNIIHRDARSVSSMQGDGSKIHVPVVSLFEGMTDDPLASSPSVSESDERELSWPPQVNQVSTLSTRITNASSRVTYRTLSPEDYSDDGWNEERRESGAVSASLHPTGPCPSAPSLVPCVDDRQRVEEEPGRSVERGVSEEEMALVCQLRELMCCPGAFEAMRLADSALADAVCKKLLDTHMLY